MSAVVLQFPTCPRAVARAGGYGVESADPAVMALVDRLEALVADPTSALGGKLRSWSDEAPRVAARDGAGCGEA